MSLLFVTILLYISVSICYIHAGIPDYCITKECTLASAFLIRVMNPLADPCKDFFEYACGGWVQNGPLPEGKDITDVIAEKAKEQSILLEAALEDDTKPLMGALKKVQQIYQSCIDPDIEENVRKPLREELARGQGMPAIHDSAVRNVWDKSRCSATEMADLLQRVHHLTFQKYEFQQPFFSVQFFGHGKLIIMLNPPKKSSIIDVELTSQVLQYELEALLNNVPLNDVQLADIVEVGKFINLLASTSNRSQNSDQAPPFFSLKDAKEKFNFLDWNKYLEAIVPPENVNIINDELVVSGFPLIDQLNSELLNMTNNDCRTLHNYIGFFTIHKLLIEMVMDIKLTKKLLKGRGPTKIIHLSCGGVMEMGHLDQGIGALYIQQYPSVEIRHKAEEMFLDIRATLTDMIKNNEWLDYETKEKALTKAKAIRYTIGFPGSSIAEYMGFVDKYYADLSLDNLQTYYEMVKSINTWALKKAIKDVFNLNRAEGLWRFSPIVHSAMSSLSENRIIVPGAELLAPTFRVNGPKSLNYGAIGVTIGHEMVHGFDTMGRKYDETGKPKNWWTNTATEQFLTRSTCFVNQFNNFDTHYDNVILDGNKTIGENIADAGGVKAAFLTYKTFIDKQGKEEARLPGLMHLSHDQLFFLSAAAHQCTLFNRKGLLFMINNDNHATGKYRVYMKMMNSKIFHKAFQCNEGSAMNPTTQCELW